MYKFARIYLGFVFLFLFSSNIFSATFTVTKTADSNDGACDADCSLREAVAAANSAASDDSIVFSSLFNTAQTINVTLGEIVINPNGVLYITGRGADLLTIDGNNTSRIISTTPNAVATLSAMTFTRGNGTGTLDSGRGGAIYNAGGTLTINTSRITGNSAANGGGLNNAASSSTAANLTLNDCVVSNNTTSGSGGGMQNFSTSTVTINRSTFMGNISNGSTGGGGGQFNGAVRITNSTFANNTAPSAGGLQLNGSLGTILTNVTVSGNTSTNNGGGIHRGTTNANFFIRNSIVAGNNGTAASPDITTSAGGITSQGNNIIGNVGTSTGWISTDLTNVNPMLGALADNGSFGMTFLPLSGSPAINAGQNCVLDLSCPANNPPIAVIYDQRGIDRPQGAAVDIGSVEVIQAAANATVSGRVVSPSGQPVGNVIVTLSSGSGVVQTALTTSFGYFSFSGIPTVQSYTISVSSKRFAFTPQNVSVNGDVTDLVITATGTNYADSNLK